MVVYFSSFFASLFFSNLYVKVEQKKKKDSRDVQLKFLLLFCSFLPLFLVAALRYNVGTDYKNYANIFYDYNSYVFETWEIGFAALCRIIFLLGGSFQWVIGISAFLILFNFYKFLETNSKDLTLSLFIFFAMAYYFQGLNIMRQWIALSFVLRGYQYLKQHNKKIFFIFVIIGAFFHIAILIYIPLYFFLIRQYPISYYIIISCISLSTLPFYSFFQDIILYLYRDSYRNSSYIFFNLDLKYIVFYTALLLIVFKCYKILLSHDKDNIILINLLFITWMLYCAFGWIPLISRIIDLFSVFMVILIPELLSCFHKKNLIKPLVYIFYFSIFCLLLIVLNFHDVLPYASIFKK